MKKQKFKRGDKVRIAKNLGPTMSHFEADQDAIVLGSYRDQYGGDNTTSYTVLLCEDGNHVSWYHQRQLRFIRHVGEKGITKVMTARDKRNATESDLGWIVTNWPSIRTRTPGATMTELMRRVGITNPWGFRGEAFMWYRNAERTHQLLDPVLSTGDLEKVKKFLGTVARKLKPMADEGAAAKL